MTEQEIFNNKLNEIRKDMLMELNNWWGDTYAGYAGIIITYNKEVYQYIYYLEMSDNLKEDKECIRKIKTLNENEFERINIFIEKEIINKQFENKQIYDAGFDVIINYNGVKKAIINNKNFGDDLGIYDKAENLLEEIICGDHLNNKKQK